MNQKRDIQARQKINQRLTETGEKEKLQEMLRIRLVECGWKDELKDYARGIVKEKGIDNVTVDELVAELTPKARASVPDDVKKELLESIRNFLADDMQVFGVMIVINR